MHSKAHSHSSIFGTQWDPANAALTIMLVLLFLVFLMLFLILAAQPAMGQTYQVLYNFTGSPDGDRPTAGVTLDPAGNLYGTTGSGGLFEVGGTAFELQHIGAGWTLTTLHSFGRGVLANRFAVGNDASVPAAGAIFGSDGSLYGATKWGGNCSDGLGLGCGTVYKLTRNPQGGWQEQLLYIFRGRTDGLNPLYGNLVFDQAGNLYGTTYSGGSLTQTCQYAGCGTVYELSPSNGGWTETVLYRFSGGTDGSSPYSGVIVDENGNLYGTTTAGGDLSCGEGGCGTVYELTPTASGWTERILYSFHGSTDGAIPYGGVIRDRAGNLYGSTVANGGTVFMLCPSGGNWTYSLLYSLPYSPGGPWGSLVMDGAGSLYGTTWGGTIFELERSGSGWVYRDLHDFSGPDGSLPMGNLIFDSAGNLYGTTYIGGSGAPDCNYNCGVVFEITP